jgi:molybdenum cofactor guanylyltransferase
LIQPGEGSVPEFAGFVLAGGRSSRMGSDKALVELGGQPLIAHALRILRDTGVAASIAGARSRLSAYAPVIGDGGHGPLGGICSALASARAARAVFVSVDMPLIPAPLVGALIHHASITGAAVSRVSSAGFTQTFPVVVDCALEAGLRAEQEAGNTGCGAALLSATMRLKRQSTILAAENLAQSGQVEHPLGLPEALWFLNVNTPAELTRAGRYIRSRVVS